MRNLKVTTYSKTYLGCLKKEYEYLLNDDIPSRVLITSGKVTYPSFLLFWKGSSRCAAGFGPCAHPDVGGSVYHWPEMVT